MRNKVLNLKTFDLLNFHCLTHSALEASPWCGRREEWMTRGRIRRRDAVVGVSGAPVCWVNISVLLFLLMSMRSTVNLSSSVTPKSPFRARIAIGTISRRRANICRAIDKPRTVLFFTERPPFFSMYTADRMEMMIVL